MKVLRVVLIVVALVAASFVAQKLISPEPEKAAGAMLTDPHGGRIAKTELDRILAATEAVTASEAKAELEARGEALFKSPAVAKRGESCASCHTVSGGVNATLGVITHHRDPAQPLSPDNFTGVREAPSLWDVADTAPYNWVGSNKTLEAQAAKAVRTHFVDENPTPERVAALASFLRTIRAPETRHDQGRLTQTELDGEEVFVGKGGCISCHGGPQFTNNLVMDTDVPQNNVFSTPSDDPGSAGVSQGFNTPHLRDIRNSAPYMHNGVFKTLREVVDFYNLNPITGGPLNLTEAEKDELVAYLRTL